MARSNFTHIVFQAQFIVFCGRCFWVQGCTWCTWCRVVHLVQGGAPHLMRLHFATPHHTMSVHQTSTFHTLHSKEGRILLKLIFCFTSIFSLHVEALPIQIINFVFNWLYNYYMIIRVLVCICVRHTLPPFTSDFLLILCFYHVFYLSSIHNRLRFHRKKSNPLFLSCFLLILGSCHAF